MTQQQQACEVAIDRMIATAVAVGGPVAASPRERHLLNLLHAANQRIAQLENTLGLNQPSGGNSE